MLIMIKRLHMTSKKNNKYLHMKKIWIFLTLFFAFATYSSWIYTGATDYGTVMTTRQQLGKKIYQEYNCQSCHQIFGLGGYLGPELTTAISDKTRGEAYVKAFIENGGGTRMLIFISVKNKQKHW